jgi:hypothetical protein
MKTYTLGDVTLTGGIVRWTESKNIPFDDVLQDFENRGLISRG